MTARRGDNITDQQISMRDHPQSTLLSRAADIVLLTARLTTHLELSNHPEPSFDVPQNEPLQTSQYAELQTQLNQALLDLQLLVLGPRQWFRSFICQPNDLAAWQVAFDFNFFELVPMHGSIALQDLASQAGLDVLRAGSVLRLLASRRCFEEVSDDRFAHSNLSAIFHGDAEMTAVGQYTLDEMFKAASSTSESIARCPRKSDPFNCAFSTRHGLPLFEYYEQRPEHARRFALAMSGITKLDRQTRELHTEFPWAELKHHKLVDVGGGSGHVSMALADKFPNLSVIVQDISKEQIAQGLQSPLYEKLKDRVHFMQHDFTTPQPSVDAGAFLLRQILHNWNDEVCVRILQSLIPALEKCRPGTPILINESILPERHNQIRVKEHAMRQLDMLMLIALGARQRTEAEFRTLLRTADTRFEIVNSSIEGSMGLLEVHLIRHQSETVDMDRNPERLAEN